VSTLALSIDRVIVETDLEREAAAGIPAILEDAFRQLAARWVRTPWARELPLASAVRTALEAEPLAVDDLLGPRGAELLAERLWQAFAAGVGRPA
jgi:hypothetical protein